MFGWFKKNKNVPLKKESTLENIPEITLQVAQIFLESLKVEISTRT